jgi:hypothetical protein
MARDGVIGDGFTPSVAIPVIRRRPVEDHLRGTWNLEGAVVHRGANSLADLSLVPNERRILAELLRAYETDGLESAWRYLDALTRAGLDSVDYWICSAMVKLGTSSVMGLIQAAQADPTILKSPEAPAEFNPRPSGIMGRLAGL